MESDQDVVVIGVRQSEPAVDSVTSPHVARKSGSKPTTMLATSYLARLQEVNFIEHKIALELERSNPCDGVVSRELLELELEALGRDRIAIEKQLASLSCFPAALAPSSSSSSSVAGKQPTSKDKTERVVVSRKVKKIYPCS